MAKDDMQDMDDERSKDDIQGMDDRQEWFNSRETLLGIVSQKYFHPFGISVVMEELRRGNENDYMPKLVSIGPRYNGRRDLLPMEEIKLRCMRSLLHRTRSPITGLKECMKGLLKLDAAVRASYVEEIKLDKYELATIMLQDGCFLLEVLFSASEYLNEALPSQLPNTEEVEVGKIEAVLTDLKLLENQIPIFIIHFLVKNLFVQHQIHTDVNEDVAKFVVEMARSLFGYPRDSTIKRSPTLDHDTAAHILELSHLLFIEESSKEENPQSSDQISDDRGKQVKQKEENSQSFIQISDDRGKYKQILNRCATRLLVAGVTINDASNTIPLNIVKSFGSGISFNNHTGLLQIPQLHITKTTETEWRNFIAWEHHIYNRSIFRERLRENRNNSSLAGDPRSCIFTLLAIVFNDLICCASDVQLLKDIKVIVVDESLKKSMTNRDLEAFFRSITNGVNRDLIHSSFIQMFDDLSKYSKTCCAIRFPVILWHYFLRIAEAIYGFVKFLRRGYNFAAGLVTILTVVQTIYAILSYHDPK